MLCKIADLITEVPEAGGLAPSRWDSEASAKNAPDRESFHDPGCLIVS